MLDPMSQISVIRDSASQGPPVSHHSSFSSSSGDRFMLLLPAGIVRSTICRVGFTKHPNRGIITNRNPRAGCGWRLAQNLKHGCGVSSSYEGAWGKKKQSQLDFAHN